MQIDWDAPITMDDGVVHRSVRIAGGELSPSPTQEGPFGQQRVPARIGVHDAPAPVDEEHPGTESIEGIGEARGLGGLRVNYPADQHRAAKVRGDEPGAAACLFVGKAVALVAKDYENRKARHRLVEHGAYAVNEALRPQPLLVEAGFQKLTKGHHVDGAERASDLG